jgi:hypothetical protein
MSASLLVVALGPGCATEMEAGVGERAAALTPVTWTDLVGVNASGNDLTKTAPETTFNAGAVSVETLSGDGYVEFTTGESTTDKLAGLSVGNGGQGYADIDFAIRLNASGRASVYEGGVNVVGIGPYAAGDVFRVQVEAGVVTYWRNGVLLHTSAAAPSFPLLVDTSLRTPGATIQNVGIQSLADFWNDVVGAQASGNDLTKTEPTTAWNAGAVSAGGISSGDGYIEFSVADNTTLKAAGLSNGNSGATLADIDFAIYLNGAGTMSVYESGTRIGGFGGYRAGDVFRVQVLAGQVRYARNGHVFYSSSVAPTYPLLLDASLRTPGTSILDASIQLGQPPVCAPEQSVIPRPSFSSDFGAHFDAAGDVMVAGDPGGNPSTTYVYRQSPSGWTVEQTLPASYHVATDGLTIAEILFNGAVQPFRYDGTEWVPEGAIAPCSWAADGFGPEVQGDLLAFGSPSLGRVYVYRRAGGTWGLDAVLSDPGGDPDDQFGFRVAIGGDRVFVGAPGMGAGGAIYVFRDNPALPDPTEPPSCANGGAGKWQQRAILQPASSFKYGSGEIDANPNGTRLLVGDLGHAHIIQLSGGVWSETALLEPFPSPGLGAGVAFGGPGPNVDSVAVVGQYVALFAEFGTGWRQIERLESPAHIAATADTIFLAYDLSGIHVRGINPACLPQ